MRNWSFGKTIITLTGISLFFDPNSLDGATYYVDAANGSDRNVGSSANTAWKTLARAESSIKSRRTTREDVTLIIAAGVYREHLFIDWGGQTNSNSKLIIEGKGDVVVKGSDQWNSGWTNEGGNVYSHSWTYDWGFADNPWTAHNVVVNPIVRRREMVFLNDRLLRQYLTYEDLVVNSYYIDEANDKLFIKLPATSNIDRLNIEVSTRATGFGLQNYNGVELRNLKFQHFSTRFQTGAASIYNSKNILIEDCEFTWNSDKGLNIGGLNGMTASNIVLRRIKNNNNGIHGFGLSFADNVLIEDFESSYNNWRGDWGRYYTWSPSNKLWSMRDLTIRRYVAKGNMATGLWLDTDNKDVVIEDSLFEENYMSGIYLEVSQGPIVLKDSIIRRNRYEGVNISNASNIVLMENQIHDNYNKKPEINDFWDRDTRSSQILVIGKNDGRTMHNRGTGKDEIVYAKNIKMRHNIIYGNTNYLFATWLDKANWKMFIDSLDSDYNMWLSNQSEVFMPYDHSASTLAKWIADTGADENSVFVSLESILNTQK